MDVNPHNPFPRIPSFFDLILDPLSTCRLFSHKNYCAGATVKLPVNPSLYRLVTTSLYSFPIVVGHGSVTLNHPHVSDLSNTPVIRLVVKTKKCPARHLTLLVFI